MKKIDWQYFIDPVSTESSLHLTQTADEHPALNADLEEVSIVYRNKKVPVYRVSRSFFDLIYKGHKKYFSIYGHYLQFFKREGENGQIHLLNNNELHSAATRSVKKAIKTLVGNKKHVSKYEMPS